MNVTGPVGWTVGEVIFAVKDTNSPWVDGFGDELSVAALVVSCITWFKMADVLPALFASHKYTAASGVTDVPRSC